MMLLKRHGVKKKQLFHPELLVEPQSVAVVEEEVLGFHVSQVEFGVFTTADDLVPQHHLIKRLPHTQCVQTGNLHEYYYSS